MLSPVNMKRLRTLLIIVLTFSPVYRSFAQQQAVYVGIPRESFNYFLALQHNSNWCWAASLQMIFNYYGVNITQEQIVGRSYGVDPGGNLPNWAGSFEVITANLNNWNIDNNGRQYAVMATYGEGPPDPLYMIRQLEAQHPVLIGYQSGPYSMHAVVITACSYIETYNGPIIQTVVVRDPWPSEDNVANEGRLEYTGIELARLIQAHWYIAIR